MSRFTNYRVNCRVILICRTQQETIARLHYERPQTASDAALLAEARQVFIKLRQAGVNQITMLLATGVARNRRQYRKMINDYLIM